MSQDIFNLQTLGEAMRPEIAPQSLRLSREERDHIAGHALDSVCIEAQELARLTHLGLDGDYKHNEAHKCSGAARKIAALSNLLGDIGWEREAPAALREPEDPSAQPTWVLGELFPVAQLRPWLQKWQSEDDQSLTKVEQELTDSEQRERRTGGREHRKDDMLLAIAEAQAKLGTGAILQARLEKWMASHGN